MCKTTHTLYNLRLCLSPIQHKDISTFYDVTTKLGTFFMVLAGTWVNTLVHLKVTTCTLQILKSLSLLMKSSRTLDLICTYKQKPLIFRIFTSSNLCLVTMLITHLEHRPVSAGDPALFITTAKPHKKASEDSISWWIKLTMSDAGINSGLFTSQP